MRSTLGRSLLGLAAAVALVGCDSLTAPDRPEAAHLKLEGPSSATLEVVVSTDFLVVDGVVSFAEADTVVVTLPVERTYRLGSPARFYIRGTNTTAQTTAFSVRIHIDDKPWIESPKTLAPEEHFEFVYRYLEPSLR